MSEQSLLPYNATEQEHAQALTVARISAVPNAARQLWSADRCPTDKLAWLAWAFSVDEWDDAWPEDSKRQTIRDALQVQKRKGTVWSIRRVLANAGYGSATLIEGLYSRTYDGSALFNGFDKYGDSTQWATYRAILDRPMTNKQAQQVRRLLEITAPARCHLVELNYTAVTNTYDGAIRYDGTFNYGTA